MPVIMFLRKSLCSGTSRHSTCWPQISTGISMVIPHLRSAFSLSKTQTYLKEPFPISAASFSNFLVVLYIR
ncbi:unnamed protein product [Gulo gulo]|uniref:Uncharacterized protein n=1 Tax=Gulo gulo TaxID=48420 RepID=A0A9X9LPH3_GULGU|nr:unnamed protein product [Gulo gulo]